VSTPGGGRISDPARTALKELDSAVNRVLEEYSGLAARVRDTEGRTRDVEELLRRFTKGDIDVGGLQETLARLEEENQDLRQRVAEGRAGVQRILDRIRFLEEHR
jgi:hypothetical protein